MTQAVARLEVPAKRPAAEPKQGGGLLSEMFQRISRLESNVIRLRRLERETTELAAEVRRRARQTLSIECGAASLSRQLSPTGRIEY